MKTSELIAEVNSLPVEERVKVTESVLRTLNSPEPEIDRKWLELAKRRLAEIESGQVETVPGEQVFGNLRKRFGL